MRRPWKALYSQDQYPDDHYPPPRLARWWVMVGTDIDLDRRACGAGVRTRTLPHREPGYLAKYLSH